MQITPGRVVAFFTPVFAAGAAALTPWLVKYTGLKINPTEVTTLAVAGATSATAAAVRFLHGSSQYERAALEFEHYAKAASAYVDAVDPGVVAKLEAGVEGAAKAQVEHLAAVIPQAWPEPPVAEAPLPVEPVVTAVAAPPAVS